MNWLLFLLNELREDAVAVQAGLPPFTYKWLLILIVLVGWMEPDDYQGMEVDVVNVCKGACYQNLWWVKETDRLKDCAIQFWIYWEALHAAARKVLQFSNEVVTKYLWIYWFGLGHTPFICKCIMTRRTSGY